MFIGISCIKGSSRDIFFVCFIQYIYFHTDVLGLVWPQLKKKSNIFRIFFLWYYCWYFSFIFFFLFEFISPKTTFPVYNYKHTLDIEFRFLYLFFAMIFFIILWRCRQWNFLNCLRLLHGNLASNFPTQLGWLEKIKNHQKHVIE